MAVSVQQATPSQSRAAAQLTAARFASRKPTPSTPPAPLQPTTRTAGARYSPVATLRRNRNIRPPAAPATPAAAATSYRTSAGRSRQSRAPRSSRLDRAIQKRTGLNQDQLERGADQLRSHLDRQAFALLATGPGALLSFLLVTVRGLATLKGAQSLPTKYIRFTEKNIYSMFSNMGRKQKPITFTAFMGPYVGFFGLFVILILILMSIAQLIILMLIPALGLGAFLGIF